MANPIKKVENLTPQINVVTVITGDNRDIATVTINDINTELWSGTMMKTAPSIVTPQDLIVGDTTIKANATFHLTCPSNFQQGQVRLNCDMKSGDNPFTPYSAVVATWQITD